MSSIKRRAFACMSLSVLGCASAWAQAPAKPDAPSAKKDPPAKSETPAAKPGVAALVGGQPITLEELDAKALKTDSKLAQSLYDARRAALDQVLMEKLLGPEAATKKVSVDQLIRDKIAEKATPVTDADVEAYYKANSARMGGKPLDQVSGQIRPFLASQRESAGRDTVLAELKQKAEVKIMLDPPRVEVVVAANDPTQGPPDAKVTIVEYSDFQ